MTIALTVNYNTPEYLERLLTSFRKFYPNLPYLVIDGSDEKRYKSIKNFDKRFDVELVHFNYNIHHGPGMAYGIKKIQTNQILLVDSDMIIHSTGWLEVMERELKESSYGIGDIQKEYYMTARSVHIPVAMSRITARSRVVVRNRESPTKTLSEKIWVDYLHPAFALCNKSVMLKYPDPVKGGAPLIEAMTKISQEGKSEKILQRAQWLTDDLWRHTQKYVQHNDNHFGMGTVRLTGGYHL